MKEDFFFGGGGGKVSNFSERDKRDLPIFFTDEGSRRGLSKNSVDVGEGNLKKFCPFQKYSLPSLQYT